MLVLSSTSPAGDRELGVLASWVSAILSGGSRSLIMRDKVLTVWVAGMLGDRYESGDVTASSFFCAVCFQISCYWLLAAASYAVTIWRNLTLERSGTPHAGEEYEKRPSQKANQGVSSLNYVNTYAMDIRSGPVVSRNSIRSVYGCDPGGSSPSVSTSDVGSIRILVKYTLWLCRISTGWG
nr:hypothetical protein Iba_chr06cCG14780 [Ipomoea batatas]